MTMHAYTGEENGNPLQYSCLENTVDGRAWWAAVHRVAQSRTRLKRLSMRHSYDDGGDFFFPLRHFLVPPFYLNI